MRIALLSDVHGNRHALDVVLTDVRSRRVDRVISLGDVAATGPEPEACIDALCALGADTVMGNADWGLLHPQPTANADPLYRRFDEIDAWCAALLSEAHRRVLADYVPTLAVDLGDGARLLAFHGSPRSFDDQITATTPVETLDGWLANTPALVYAGGHTHQPFLRRYRQAYLVNPGSVGLAWEQDAASEQARNRSWAEYAILDIHAGCIAVEHRRLPYDGRAVVERALERGMPYAEWWGRDIRG